MDYPERLVTGRRRDEARLVLSNSVLAIEVTIYSDCETPVLKARLLQTVKFHLREKKSLSIWRCSVWINAIFLREGKLREWDL